MNTNRKIVMMMAIMSILFLSLIAYLSYFTMFVSAKISDHPLNGRARGYEDSIKRGSIIDCNGVVLAETKEDSTKRIYPYGSLYSHLIGYSSPIYGKSQIESKYNDYLNGRDNLAMLFNFNPTATGYDLHLTISHNLQKTASDALGRYSGSIVALDPRTGALLAAVSKPDFNPNADALEANWKDLVENRNSPLLPRAFNGRYTPGSTFKVITSAIAIDHDLHNETFNDTGRIIIDGKEFTNSGGRALGTISLKTALAKSSNTVFCNMAAKRFDDKEMHDMATNFGFNTDIPFDLPLSKSTFPQRKMSQTERASAAIGQWEIMSTPFQMALTSAIIANDGIMASPYMLKKVVNSSKSIVFENKKLNERRVIPAASAQIIKEMMVESTVNGTATNARISGISVAAKTGTSENELKGKEHTWLIAFAPSDNPQISVAISLEYTGGSGGDLAAPIAKKVMESYFFEN